MLFLRSVCLVALAAFVALTSASPLEESGVKALTRPPNIDMIIFAISGNHWNRFDDDDLIRAARKTSQALEEIFSTTKNQLVDVEERYKSPNVDNIGPCLKQVQGILADVLIDIKGLEGKYISYNLGDRTILGLANLLCAVL
ncbi:hypothetical protein J132_09960 [Termitomyces sp. J132]|nr:hypothetical protein C0989_008505 [Termitomyces sp. Mn162]KAH0579286.1 hypothetical protein H2248_003431 [Termitomyces sp. 'cryptogamus']KNZ76538.1 hypothetical protein J132_09960 [Termitomyces sp. J132]